MNERTFATTDPAQVIHIRITMIEAEAAKLKAGVARDRDFHVAVEHMINQIIEVHSTNRNLGNFARNAITRIFNVDPHNPVFKSRSSL